MLTSEKGDLHLVESSCGRGCCMRAGNAALGGQRVARLGLSGCVLLRMPVIVAPLDTAKGQ